MCYMSHICIIAVTTALDHLIKYVLAYVHDAARRLLRMLRPTAARAHRRMRNRTCTHSYAEPTKDGWCLWGLCPTFSTPVPLLYVKVRPCTHTY
jgi:hypothetical protein